MSSGFSRDDPPHDLYTPTTRCGSVWPLPNLSGFPTGSSSAIMLDVRQVPPEHQHLAPAGATVTKLSFEPNAPILHEQK